MAPLLPGMDRSAELAMTTATSAKKPMRTIQMSAARPFSNTRTDADCPAGDVLSIIGQKCTALTQDLRILGSVGASNGNGPQEPNKRQSPREPLRTPWIRFDPQGYGGAAPRPGDSVRKQSWIIDFARP